MHRGRFVLGITAVELIIALSRLQLQAPARLPGGDPGGRIHRSLVQVIAALPGDAKVMSRYDAGAEWTGCAGKAGTAGRRGPLIAIRFRTAADPGTVVARTDAALTAMGWAPVPDLRDTVWARRAGHSVPAGTARLSLNPADQTWSLTASEAGCGT
jgi:hypothetical protein